MTFEEWFNNRIYCIDEQRLKSVLEEIWNIAYPIDDVIIFED